MLTLNFVLRLDLLDILLLEPDGSKFPKKTTTSHVMFATITRTCELEIAACLNCVDQE